MRFARGKLPQFVAMLLGLAVSISSLAFSGAGNAGRGKEIFKQRCAMCHGTDGRGQNGMAPDFIGEWTRLAKSDEELSQNIRSGALHTPGKIYMGGQCPPKIMEERDMDDVLAYLRAAFADR